MSNIIQMAVKSLRFTCWCSFLKQPKLTTVMYELKWKAQQWRVIRHMKEKYLISLPVYFCFLSCPPNSFTSASAHSCDLKPNVSTDDSLNKINSAIPEKLYLTWCHLQKSQLWRNKEKMQTSRAEVEKDCLLVSKKFLKNRISSLWKTVPKN